MENSTAVKRDEKLKSSSVKPVNPVKELVIMGLLVAMVFVCTTVIQFKLPIAVNGGLVHMGNVALFTIAIVLGKKRGAVSGAFGMALFDILGPWAVWAPFTFVVRGIMGYVIGFFADINQSNGKNPLWNIVGITLGSIWMMVGYYFSEVILYGNWVAPFSSIPGNLTQLGIGLILALPLSAALTRVSKQVGRV